MTLLVFRLKSDKHLNELWIVLLEDEMFIRNNRLLKPTTSNACAFCLPISVEPSEIISRNNTRITRRRRKTRVYWALAFDLPNTVRYSTEYRIRRIRHKKVFVKNVVGILMTTQAYLKYRYRYL